MAHSHPSLINSWSAQHAASAPSTASPVTWDNVVAWAHSEGLGTPATILDYLDSLRGASDVPASPQEATFLRALAEEAHLVPPDAPFTYESRIDALLQVYDPLLRGLDTIAARAAAHGIQAPWLQLLSQPAVYDNGMWPPGPVAIRELAASVLQGDPSDPVAHAIADLVKQVQPTAGAAASSASPLTNESRLATAAAIGQSLQAPSGAQAARGPTASSIKGRRGPPAAGRASSFQSPQFALATRPAAPSYGAGAAMPHITTLHPAFGFGTGPY